MVSGEQVDNDHQTEDKIDFLPEDIETTLSVDQTSSGSRGVERILCPIGKFSSLNHQHIESIIRNAVGELAQHGKRISLAPKRMADGIAIDWIYDISVRDQNLDDILREIPRDDLKGSLSSAPGGSKAGAGRHAGDPIVVDLDNEANSPLNHRDLVAFQSSSHICGTHDEPLCNGNSKGRRYPVDSLKRKSTSPDNHFTLRNLSREMNEATLQKFLVESGTPQNAILGIRLRTIGNSIIATIDLADGYAFPDIRQSLYATWAARVSESESSQNSTLTTTSDTPITLRTPRATPRNESSSYLPTKYNAEPEVIDLVSDDSDMEISEDDAVKVEDPVCQLPEAVDQVASPALSYLTIDGADPGDDGINRSLPENDYVDNSTHALCSGTSDSSDEGSEGEDISQDQIRAVASIPPRSTSEEDLAQQLLHGPIGTVDDFLAQDRARFRNIRTWSATDTPTPEMAGNVRNDRNVGRVNTRSLRRNQTDLPGPSTSRRVNTSNKPPSRGGPPIRPVVDTGFTIGVPKASYARGRRLLVASDRTIPIAAVYMRGDLQFIDQTRRVKLSRFSLPVEDEDANPRHVADAHLLKEDMIVVGYNEGYTQASCIALAEDARPARYDLKHRAHNTVHEHRRTGTSSLNRGVSSMCVLDERAPQFLSGGEDGAVHLWTVSHTVGEFSATSEKLGIQHTQHIQCISHRASDHRVFTCYSQYMHSADFEATTSKPSDAVFMSSKPQQIHIHPLNPCIVILEVDHRDRQVQIYDTRKSNFRAAPCIEFGYQTAKSSESMRRVYRYFKGSTVHSLFARGYQNGVACVWDYRKPQAVLERFQEQRRDPIEHAVLQDSGTLIAYGGHTITFWSINGV